MNQKQSNLGAGWWAKNLDEIDREVVRLATICNVRILDPGIIERVLQNDASVCGSSNPVAFKKLRDALTMHYHARDKTAGVLGQTHTTQLVTEIFERLKAQVGDRLGGTPPK